MMRYTFCLSLLLVASLASTVSAQNLVVNNSFESVNASDYQFGQYMDRIGTWGADGGSSVTAENGITPLDGSRMLKFLDTSFFSTSGLYGEVSQVVLIGGNESLTATAFFNRINQANADTTMGIGIYAYSGSVSNYSTAVSNPLAINVVTLVTDADENTWEQVSANLLTPANTTYVEVDLVTDREGSPHEFYGNYADNVSLFRDSVVPEPGALALLLAGGLTGAGLLARRRRQ